MSSGKCCLLTRCFSDGWMQIFQLLQRWLRFNIISICLNQVKVSYDLLAFSFDYMKLASLQARNKCGALETVERKNQCLQGIEFLPFPHTLVLFLLIFEIVCNPSCQSLMILLINISMDPVMPAQRRISIQALHIFTKKKKSNKVKTDLHVYATSKAWLV